MYNESIKEFNALIDNKEKEYNIKLNELNALVEKKEEVYNNKINELNALIEKNEKAYNNTINELNVLIEKNEENYNKKIDELKLQMEEKNNNQIIYPELPKENSENKVINLGRFFNNRRKNNRIFSIYEPINYEDLERLAIEVISLNNEETKILAK